MNFWKWRQKINLFLFLQRFQMSRSTTPPEESHGANLQHSALNYSSPSPGNACSQSSSSLPVLDRPYKPKFHKVFYQNNNNTNSISQIDDSKPTPLIKGKQCEVNIESTALSHPPLVNRNLNYRSLNLMIMFTFTWVVSTIFYWSFFLFLLLFL